MIKKAAIAILLCLAFPTLFYGQGAASDLFFENIMDSKFYHITTFENVTDRFYTNKRRYNTMELFMATFH